jgi:hypothetical protein
MRFMVMIYGSHEAWAALTPAAGEEIGRAHRALQAELGASGELVDHKELLIEGARVLRPRNGAGEVTEGPFSEGRELLSGYYLIDVAGLERAIEIAGRFGESAFAAIEVRRVSGDSSWDPPAPDGPAGSA